MVVLEFNVTALENDSYLNSKKELEIGKDLNFAVKRWSLSLWLGNNCSHTQENNPTHNDD